MKEIIAEIIDFFKDEKNMTFNQTKSITRKLKNGRELHVLRFADFPLFTHFEITVKSSRVEKETGHFPNGVVYFHCLENDKLRKLKSALKTMPKF